MSENEMDVVEPGEGGVATGWTTANILKLIGSIRSNIPESEKKRAYRSALSAVDWEKVAFPPFSPDECRETWTDVMQKMHKLRSLPELITEAEEAISNPLCHKKIHTELPKTTAPPKIVYMWKHFSTLQKKHPGLTMTKLGKMAFEKYDKLPDEEKAKYEKKHALRVEEYRRKMEEFCKENNLALSRTLKRKKGIPANEIDGLPEKPPKNGLSLFVKENTKTHGHSLGKGFFKVMAQRWRELTETERQEYCTRCQEMKIEYNAKLTECLMSVDETEKLQFIEEKGFRLPKKFSKKTFAGEPKMPSQTGFVYFAKDQMKFLKEKMSSHADRLAYAKKLWYKLPTNEKERYKELIQTNIKQYSEDLNKWFKTLSPEEQTEYLTQNPSKSQFLEARKRMVYGREELLLCQPSDSEDEDIDVISSEEEAVIWSDYEDENGEDEEDEFMFEMYS